MYWSANMQPATGTPEAIQGSMFGGTNVRQAHHAVNPTPEAEFCTA